MKRLQNLFIKIATIGLLTMALPTFAIVQVDQTNKDTDQLSEATFEFIFGTDDTNIVHTGIAEGNRVGPETLNLMTQVTGPNPTTNAPAQENIDSSQTSTLEVGTLGGSSLNDVSGELYSTGNVTEITGSNVTETTSGSMLIFGNSSYVQKNIGESDQTSDISISNLSANSISKAKANATGNALSASADVVQGGLRQFNEGNDQSATVDTTLVFGLEHNPEKSSDVAPLANAIGNTMNVNANTFLTSTEKWLQKNTDNSQTAEVSLDLMFGEGGQAINYNPIANTVGNRLTTNSTIMTNLNWAQENLNGEQLSRVNISTLTNPGTIASTTSAVGNYASFNSSF